jgi:hypothetical protein
MKVGDCMDPYVPERKGKARRWITYRWARRMIAKDRYRRAA